MSPTMMSAPPVAYTPTSDAMDRHEYGITKNRKTTSTGGGRAWSEDEVRGFRATRAADECMVVAMGAAALTVIVV